MVKYKNNKTPLQHQSLYILFYIYCTFKASLMELGGASTTFHYLTKLENSIVRVQDGLMPGF